MRAGSLRQSWGQSYSLGTLGIPLLGLQEGEPSYSLLCPGVWSTGKRKQLPLEVSQPSRGDQAP